MMELLKSPHSGALAGFAMGFPNGYRVEVDFGPMSMSERNTATKKEFEMNPRSSTAEVRVFNPQGSQEDQLPRCQLETLIKVLADVFERDLALES